MRDIERDVWTVTAAFAINIKIASFGLGGAVLFLSLSLSLSD
jgi:hypothetical protein